VALRKRAGEAKSGDRAPEHADKPRTRERVTFAARVERAFAADPIGARRELEELLARLGLRLADGQARSEPSCPANSVAGGGTQGG
jgi:hypothetical protein